MICENEDPKDSNEEIVNSDRREFLRNSIYAAYATPIITTLLVAEQSIAGSGCPPKCLIDPDHPSCAGCK
jgi:hypothetical protein